MRRMALLGCCLGAALVSAPPASAAVGDLTGAGCIALAGSPASGCNSTGGEALNGATGVAVSPDGANVYVVSYEHDSITTFTRTPGGALTGAGCIAKTTAQGCTATGGGALDGPTTVAISPDGNNVYVVANKDDAITAFNRSAGGVLTAAGCIAKPGGTAVGCDTADGGALDGAGDLAVSTTSVYVTAFDDDAVSAFTRAGNGSLDGSGCIAKPGSTATGCNTTDGGALDGAAGVTISPGGTNVYVTASEDDSITVFTRAVNGDLNRTGCIARSGGGTTATGCTNIGGDVLDGAGPLAVSPDGASVYVLSFGDVAITTFDRGAAGVLTGRACIAKPFSPAAMDCDLAGGGALFIPVSLAVSPDGLNVYVTSVIDDAVSVFSRAGNGALTGIGCIARSGAGSSVSGCNSAGGGALDGASGVALSPSGNNAYVTASDDDAVSAFNRALPTTPIPTPTKCKKKKKKGKKGAATAKKKCKKKRKKRARR